MKEIILPNEISDESCLGEDVIVIPYESKKTSIKTKIILDYYLFSFIIEGEKTVDFASGTLSINNENFLFLPYGKSLMSERLAHHGHYRSLLFFVNRNAFLSFFNNQHFYNRPRGLVNIFDFKPKSFSIDSYVTNFIAGMQIASSDSKLNNKDFYWVKFSELMTYLLCKDKNLESYFVQICQGWNEDAYLRKIVNIQMYNRITVEELAFLCNMSLSTFKRKFLKAFGEAPKQWIFKARMKKAADLLKNQGLTASEIYEDLCYDNLSSFVQAFKQYYGITPKKFQMLL